MRTFLWILATRSEKASQRSIAIAIAVDERQYASSHFSTRPKESDMAPNACFRRPIECSLCKTGHKNYSLPAGNQPLFLLTLFTFHY